MILADSSVVIAYARGKDAKLTRLIPLHPAAVCGIVQAELLCGARDAAHRRKMLNLLAAFPQISMPESVWEIVGDSLAALRRQGVIVPFPDVAVASLGILNGLEVWARDSHFARMQTVLPPLKLFQEPP